MSVPYRITIRVSEDLIEKLQEIVDKQNYSSISDAIREAINDFIKKNKSGLSGFNSILMDDSSSSIE